MNEFLLFATPAITFMLTVVALVFLIDGLIDILTDAIYIAWRFYRRLVFKQEHRPLSENLLGPEKEQLAAILVPAWQEDAVIGQMLDNTVATLKYNNYVIFVGTYPNDQKTIDAVSEASARHPGKVALVILDHDGPTTKADCLNGILRYLHEVESRSGYRFEFLVLDDAEDLVPAYELKVMNHLIPRKDIVQIAVFPVKAKWWEFTAGHYMDEFAVLHLKDMRTREWMTGIVPSAGVGTAFSRRVIDLACALRGEAPFDREALTEDYELPLSLASHNVKEVFVNSGVKPDRRGAHLRKHSPAFIYANQVQAVRSVFPRTFTSAVRQKSRWVLGIGLQGWEHLGWRGSLWHRFMLFRDRRALIGNLANVLGYVLVLFTLALWGCLYAAFGVASFPNVVPEHSLLWYLIMANFFIMCFQLISRAVATYKIYGFMHAILSVPRAVWGNLINFEATVRALRIYFTAKRQGVTDIPWDKTSHEFPS